MTTSPVVLYMLVDVTSIESTKILRVAPLRHVQLYGAIERAHGKTVVAPPLEGRGFGKFDTAQMQYIFWNLTQQTPPSDYAELVKGCLEAAGKLPLDPTPLSHLEREVAKLYPDGETFGQGPKEASVRVERHKREEAGVSARPKAGSSTGKVWEIADEMSTADAPANRKEVIAACEAAGINTATASTQFSKWLKARNNPDL